VSFFKDIDWSEVDLDDISNCGRSIMGCPKPETKEEKARLKLLSDRIKNEADEVKKFESQVEQAYLRQEQDREAKKVRKKYIIYGLIAVAGYFAYKKFKK